MDKFYVGRLLESSPANQSDLERKTQLVEVQYVRRPSSFGVVHLIQEKETRPLAGDRKCNKTQVCLTVLDIVDQDCARFKVVRLIELDNRLVDFDSSLTVTLETQEVSQCHCVALCSDGDILALDLAAGCSQRLTGASHRESGDNFVACKLQQTSDERRHVHVLSQRCYFLYQLTGANTLALLNKTSAGRGTDFTGAQLHTVPFQPEIILIELADSSVRVLHRTKHINSLEDSPIPSFYLTLAKLSSSNEAMILRYSGSQLSAYRLKVGDESNEFSTKDPDNLLAEEPTNDLEHSWMIDLADIDSLRFISDEARGQSMGCLGAVYSHNQLNQNDCLPKFLVVTYKHHLLVYSFEQKLSLPFTVSSFHDLNKSPQLKPSSRSDLEESVNLEQKPKLLHNFKLIGTNPTDGLFNSIFLAREANLIQCRHFHQLGLLVSLSSCTDLLVFKFLSDRIAPKQDSIYQQQLASCMARGSFLNDQIERTKSYNANLRQDIAKLENRSLNADRLMESLDSLIQVELERRREVGCLYDLNIVITNLVQVSKIVVTSTARSYWLKPSGQSVAEYHIDNNAEQTNLETFLLTNIDSNLSAEEILKLKPTDREEESQEIQASIVIQLDKAGQTRKQTTLNLPIYLIDGQTSKIKVYFVLKNPSMGGVVRSRSVPTQDSSEDMKFHQKTMQIKPLISYRQVYSESWPTQDAIKVKIASSVQADILLKWLDECFDAEVPGGIVESSFTRSSISYKVGDGIVEVESRDIMALELIKKRLLKRATDQSIRLEIEQLKIADVSLLRDLIEKQCQNIQTIAKTQGSTTIELKAEDIEPTDLVIETLLNEMHSIELPEGVSLESLEKSLRLDIEANLKGSDNAIESNIDEQLDQETDIMQDLIFGHIIDLLVDFDVLQGLKASSVEKMLLMRSKLAYLMQHTDAKHRAAMILREWQSIKELATL